MTQPPMTKERQALVASLAKQRHHVLSWAANDRGVAALPGRPDQS
jgi:hypothetical protein